MDSTLSHSSTKPFGSIQEATAYLEGLINRERDPTYSYTRLSLEPIQNLMELLGNPQDKLKVLHIAGSKGKGSTALLAEAVLREAGYRVGTFTSPHLESWTERFRIDGSDVAADVLTEAVETVRPHVEALRTGEDPPSFFDATTAVALLLFEAATVDIAILEVGLGGRLDSTNVVDPVLTCITSIELEHTDKLGTDLATIASEKAGIFKRSCPAIIGALPAPAREVAERIAKDLSAPLFRLGHEFGVEKLDDAEGNGRFRFWTERFEVERELPLLGDHQFENAALALAAVLNLPGLDSGKLLEASTLAFQRVSLPGRIEVVRVDAAGRPRVIVDNAHTEVSARRLVDALNRLPRRRLQLVLSISKDKNLESILPILLKDADRVVVTSAEDTRSLDSEELAHRVRGVSSEVELDVIEDPEEAVRKTATDLGVGDLLCVTGSVYLAGIARRVLRRE